LGTEEAELSPSSLKQNPLPSAPYLCPPFIRGKYLFFSVGWFFYADRGTEENVPTAEDNAVTARSGRVTVYDGAIVVFTLGCGNAPPKKAMRRPLDVPG
jgi:hypothetical protein